MSSSPFTTAPLVHTSGSAAAATAPRDEPDIEAVDEEGEEEIEQEDEDPGEEDELEEDELIDDGAGPEEDNKNGDSMDVDPVSADE